MLATNIDQLVSQNILDHHENTAKNKNLNVPVIHFKIDLRILVLNEQLSSYQKGNDVTSTKICEFEVSDILYKINMKYFNDID